MSGHPRARAAIIGAGLMGRWHADAVKRIGGRVAVIVDTDLSATTALGKQHPRARLAVELDPTLVAREATVAHVCTPVETHEATISRLIDAGLHILAEKPLAPDADGTSRLLSLAAMRGVLLCPVHQFVFQDGFRQLRRWSPTLGAVRRIEFSAFSAGAKATDAESLDALVAEILPHPLALAGAILETPLADANWQVAHPTPGELQAVATAAGAIVDVAISAHGRPTETMLRVIADNGSASIDLFHGFAVRHDGTVSRRAKIAHPFLASGRQLRGASSNLVRRAARREPAYPGLRELVREFYEAASSGAEAPLQPNAVLDVAITRDRILALLKHRP